jgi:hypothetical protein
MTLELVSIGPSKGEDKFDEAYPLRALLPRLPKITNVGLI